MPIKPVGPRVMVKVIAKEEKKKKKNELIILPDNIPNEREATKRGEIVAVGFNFKYLDPKVGMKIVFNNFSHTDIKDGEESYLIIEEGDILALCQ